MIDRALVVRPAPARRAWVRTALGVTAVLVLIAVGTTGCAPQAGTSAPRATTGLDDVRHSAAPTAPTPGPTAAPTAAAPTPTAMTRSVPVRVEIPSIDLDSELMELGLRDDGTMEVPPDAFPAGWYGGAPTPGELGPAVIAGHIDWRTGPAVFARLAEVAVGDEVTVTRTDASVAVFAVTSVGQFAKDAFPTDLVYGDIDHAGLRLITCGGSWDAEAGHYRDNTVVFAELVPTG